MRKYKAVSDYSSPQTVTSLFKPSSQLAKVIWLHLAKRKLIVSVGELYYDAIKNPFYTYTEVVDALQELEAVGLVEVLEQVQGGEA